MACLAVAPGTAAAAVDLPDDFGDEVIVGGLDQPTSMAQLPDGRVLITEQRSGKVRLVVNGAIAAKDPIFVVPDLNSTGYERGFQGIAVDPNWPIDPYVYLSYNRTGGKIRLVRYTVWYEVGSADGDTLEFVQPRILIDDIPDNDPNHNAGCLRFGPDGHLYMSLGEDEDVCSAADSTTLKGQILRLDVSNLPLTGAITRDHLTPPDNPYWFAADSNARLVWAYGMRNPWRFHIDPVFGAIYAADVGEADYEELNEVLPGDFLGWPWREGPMVMDRTGFCPEPGGLGANDFKGPIVALDRDPALTSIVSAGMYRPPLGGSAKWPLEYYDGAHGSVFYGEYFGGWLRRLKKQGGVWQPAPMVPGQPNSEDWATGLPRPVDFAIDAEGNLLWLSQFNESGVGATGSLRRIRYLQPVSTPPPSAAPGAMLASPNPFFARTRLTFSLAAAAPVELDVFDVSGRRVRRLYDATAPAGALHVDWDGRDDAGSPVPPGAYLIRFARPGAVETARLVRLR